MATKGERKAYVLTSEQAQQKVVDVFTVHAGEAGQYWAVTVSAAAPARWPAGLNGSSDSVAFSGAPIPGYALGPGNGCSC